MEKSTDCVIVAGDGKRLVADKRMLADSSTFFRDILSTLCHLEEQVIQLPSLDGKMVELLIQIIKGEACVDVWAVENKHVLEAAELVGIVPQSNMDFNDFMEEFSLDQEWDLSFGRGRRNQA
eukprot:TRINITY_DN7105_c0_g1_i1.p1 TRINITY_DN7105_c0_g1~~TRINITY_DN7105_c0_g1_i1.p1  ORF type:complete len:122 (-),score=25.57 TRINITY_DN7105_c0_g1_i1:182-547(-)